MKRLIFLDFLRGIMIFIMITYHALVYCVFEGIDNALAIIPDNIMPFLLPLLLLLTWAALFAMISGIAKSYNMYQKIIRNEQTLVKAIQISLVRGFFILFLHYVYLGLIGHFQRNLEGDPVRSLLIGSLERGFWAILDYEILFYTDALLMTSLSGILISLFLLILWKKNGIYKVKRNVIVLTISGLGWLFLSPILQNLLYPIFENAMNKENYFVGMIFSWLVGPRHCMFPYFSFAIFGSVFGIFLGFPELRKRKTIASYGYGLGAIFLIVDGIVIIFQGMPQITSELLPFSMYVLNLGLMLILVTSLILTMEFQEKEKKKQIILHSRLFRKFGMLTLSMYLIESTISLLLFKLFQLIFQVSLQTSLFLVLFYLFVNGCIWALIAISWAKIYYKFSFEWLTDKFLQLTTSHKSSRLKTTIEDYI